MTDDQWGAGERAKWHSSGLVRVGDKAYPLIYGEHPHSRRDNNHYVEMGKEVVGFDGHRIEIDVKIETRNYLKESHLSGDEVRKGGSGQIIADGEIVFEFFLRDAQWGLLHAHRLIGELSEHSSGWLMRSEREKLIGRKVYYRERPAVIERLITGQGCVILATEDGRAFPPPVWHEEDDIDDGDNTVKTEVTDPNIWWHRS